MYFFFAEPASRLKKPCTSASRVREDADVFPGGKAFQVALERSCTSSLMFFAQVLQAFAHRSTMCKGLQVVAVALATTEKHMTEVQHTAEPCKKKIKHNLHNKIK